MNMEVLTFVLFLGTSFAIGIGASRYIKDVSDYYVAGASAPWYLLTGTFVASNVSAGLFLGATNVNALHGYAMWCAYVTTSIGFLISIGVVGVFVRRLANHYEVYDFADILAVRYPSRSRSIRASTAAVLPVVYIPMLAAQLIALATIASIVFDADYSNALIAVVLVVVVYTLLGGMLGVVWSDGFQFIVLFLGLVIAVPLGFNSLDTDAAQVWATISDRAPDIFQWQSDDWPWYLALGQLVWIFAIPVQPHLVTRFLTARSERDIYLSLPICMIACLIIFSSTVPLGLLGKEAVPNLADGQYYYVVMAREVFGQGLGAFALAGITAASLSTCSTVLVVTGQTLSRDLGGELFGWWQSEKSQLIAARVCVLIIGIFAFALAYLQVLGIFWLVVLSASLLASIFFVPLLVGFFWPGASATGALVAMYCGGIAAIVVYGTNQLLGTHYFVSEVFAGILASGLAMFWVSKRYPATQSETQVLRKLTE